MELLVVIAIIAVLLSILLPSLQHARKAARAVKCAAHLRGLAQAATNYTTEENGWFAGPNTTGLGLADDNAWGATRPCTRWDWVSPVLGEVRGFSGDRLTRFQDICMSALSCPDNNLRYGGKYQGPDLPMWLNERKHPLTLSYILPAYFHLYPSGSHGPPDPQDTNKPMDVPGMQGISVPDAYRPMFEFAGTPARKVYAFEGARYFDPRYGDTYFDYTTTIPTTGLVGTPQGNMASRGPAFKEFSGGGEAPPFADEWFPNAKSVSPVFTLVSLRHQGRMNVAFLDGHVDGLRLLQAIDPALYAPSGSTINDVSKLWAMWLNGEGHMEYERGDLVP
ncbi:MAG: prepilin-type N-terminal cleavage/methylation domain-containing protein [Phycisphaerae bacterium]